MAMRMKGFSILQIALISLRFSPGSCGEPYDHIAETLTSYPLPDLNYDYNEMEPFIDTRTMQIHHQGHHGAYTSKMNKALKEWRESDEDKSLLSIPLFKILQRSDEIPEKWRTSMQNNGGGYINHALYFGTISPNPSGKVRTPTPTLNLYIKRSFGNFTSLKNWMTEQAMKLFGSGYVWLCREPKQDFLTLFSTPNQQSPFLFGLEPILVIDLWEHAYYLKHQNRRAQHIEDWWIIVNWEKVEKLLHWWSTPIKVKTIHSEL